MTPEQMRMRVADYKADPEMGAAWHRWSEGTVLELLDAVEWHQGNEDRVRLLHTPRAVYDECECTEEQKTDGRHVEIEEIGLTCELMYYICVECCVENPQWPEQAEWCHDKHKHLPGDLDPENRCPTIRMMRRLES